MKKVVTNRDKIHSSTKYHKKEMILTQINHQNVKQKKVPEQTDEQGQREGMEDTVGWSYAQ